MKIKAIFSAVFSALIVLSSVSLQSFAASSGKTEDDLTDGTFTYELINGTYTIVSCEPTVIGLEELPDFRNGYAVTAIGDNAFAGCSYISKLKIPDSITSIGSSAFAGCTSLTEIELPSKLQTLSNSVFMGCNHLKSVDIPDSVRTIESYAFYNCSELTDVKLSGELSTIKPMAFAECSAIENIDASACSSYVFEDGILYNSSRTNISRASVKLSGDVYIPEGVTAIDAGAFSVCVNIENLFFPVSLSYIGDDAFGYCMGLKSVDFSEGLKTIAPVAFKNCASLQALDFPTTLQEIGEGAFYNCSELKRVVISEGTSSVGNGAFVNCTNLTQLSVPKSVTSIGENAFGYNLDDEGNYSLKSDFSLSVFSDSEGAKYARANKIEYSSVDRSLKKIAFITVAVGIILAAAVFAAVLMARGKKSASLAVRKADKAAKEKEAEENYEKIIDDNS